MSRIGLLDIIREMKFRYFDDEVPALGAQMAYSLLLSFFPFLIFLITLVGYSPVSVDEILSALSDVLPDDAFQLVRTQIIQINRYKSTGLLSLGFAVTLFMASNGVGAVIHGLNKAYDEKEKRPFWKVKGLSILYTVIFSFVILISFLVLIFGEVIGLHLASRVSLSGEFWAVWNNLRYLIMLVFMNLVFMGMYCCLPSRKLSLREVIPGAIFATVGWTLVSLGFSYYVNNFGQYSNIYGSIGGVIVLLIWLFLSAVIVLLGGELNAAMTLYRDGKKRSNGKR